MRLVPIFILVAELQTADESFYRRESVKCEEGTYPKMSFTLSKNVEFRSAGLFSTFIDCPSCSRIRFCSRETFAGTTTRMLMYISPLPAMRIRQALAFPENLPGLRPFRNFQIFFALEASAL